MALEDNDAEIEPTDETLKKMIDELETYGVPREVLEENRAINPNLIKKIHKLFIARLGSVWTVDINPDSKQES